MSTLFAVLLNGVWATVLAISCYVLGNRRAMRIIEFRERQAARVDGSLTTDEPVYRKCLCGHQTTSHKLGDEGVRGKCNAWVTGKGHCACQGYVADPKTVIK